MAERVEVQVLVDNVTDQLSTNPQQVHSELSCLLHAGMVEYAPRRVRSCIVRADARESVAWLARFALNFRGRSTMSPLGGTPATPSFSMTRTDRGFSTC